MQFLMQAVKPPSNVVLEGTPAHILNQSLGYPSDKQPPNSSPVTPAIARLRLSFPLRGTFPKVSEPFVF